jgi:hypothetical protein
VETLWEEQRRSDAPRRKKPDERVVAPTEPVVREEEPGWRFRVYPGAREAGGVFWAHGFERGRKLARGAPDPERSAEEASRRARSKVRRYCAANRLNRLGTLTYAGEGCHDPSAFRADIAGFIRRLRGLLGEGDFPYVWVPEWHKQGHGLHGHVAVGRYIKRSLIEEAWGRGFVHIKLLGDLPVGSEALEQARLAARYLSKYLVKDFDEMRTAGLHRYEVGQGFQPASVPLHAYFLDDALTKVSTLLGGEPAAYVWAPECDPGSERPPLAWASWRS